MCRTISQRKDVAEPERIMQMLWNGMQEGNTYIDAHQHLQSSVDIISSSTKLDRALPVGFREHKSVRSFSTSPKQGIADIVQLLGLFLSSLELLP
mmetsp:Transcript_2859/g.5641  ORF Transcript_2859/g.5641 Transcript_2859/m.5641 type:complete len:95 (+) Transcript_2859:470-754(+)